MTNACTSPAGLSDNELLIQLRRSVADERTATAHLIRLLAEADARRLYLAEGCSSLFTYCTQVLHLSEHAAYGRITAARLTRRMPAVLEALRAGDVTLTTVGLIGPHLTFANCAEFLAAVRHKSKRDVERLVSSLAPKPDVAASVRKVPARTVPRRCEPSTGSATPAQGASRLRQASLTEASAPETEDAPPMRPAITPAPTPPAVVAPLTPERYKIQFTASREMHDKLRRAQDLLRHSIPDGDVAAVVDRALTLLVEELERRKLAAVAHPRPTQSLTSETRYIPAAVKRIVWARDGGQCTFLGTHGRCTERGFLEFHHVMPFAAGGETSADNLVLRCRSHNQFEAEQFFGPLFARESRTGYDIELGPDGARALQPVDTSEVFRQPLPSRSLSRSSLLSTHSCRSTTGEWEECARAFAGGRRRTKPMTRAAGARRDLADADQTGRRRATSHRRSTKSSSPFPAKCTTSFRRTQDIRAESARHTATQLGPDRARALGRREPLSSGC